MDGTVIRMPKAYPIYDAAYRDHLDSVRDFIDPIPNLHTVGRNGMHKYNNQDHSMLTAMMAVWNMQGASHDIWAVNTDFEYHEEQKIGVADRRCGCGRAPPLLTQQTGRPIVNGRRIRAILDEGRFDVVNFNNISLIGGPGLLAYAPSAIRVYFAHEHWLVCPTHVLWRHNQEVCTGRECLRCSLSHRRPPQLWRFAGYLEKQLRHVDVFIAMSEFSRDKHHEFGVPHDMEVLPYFLPDPGAGGTCAIRRLSASPPVFPVRRSARAHQGTR